MHGILAWLFSISLAAACPGGEDLLAGLPTYNTTMHALARDFVSGEPLSLDVALDSRGYAGPHRGYALNPNVLFIRDYSPVLIKRGERTLALTYMAPLLKGEVASGRATSGRETRFVPLELEGGNVLATDEFLFTSDKVFKKNSTRSPAEIIDLLARATDTDPSRVIVLPWMPGERTGHVDMYIGVLGPRSLAIPRISDDAIAQLGYAHEISYARGLNAWLDARAAELASRGLVISRLPMLPPKNLIRSSLSPFGWDGFILTPVNWARKGATLYVPSFPKWNDSALTPEIAAELKRHGYQTVFVDADRLLSTRGLLHCISAEY